MTGRTGALLLARRGLLCRRTSPSAGAGSWTWPPRPPTPRRCALSRAPLQLGARLLAAMKIRFLLARVDSRLLLLLLPLFLLGVGGAGEGEAGAEGGVEGFDGARRVARQEGEEAGQVQGSGRPRSARRRAAAAAASARSRNAPARERAGVVITYLQSRAESVWIIPIPAAGGAREGREETYGTGDPISRKAVGGILFFLLFSLWIGRGRWYVCVPQYVL